MFFLLYLLTWQYVNKLFFVSTFWKRRVFWKVCCFSLETAEMKLTAVEWKVIKLDNENLLRTGIFTTLRHQRSVASRHGKIVDSKVHKYVEYKQKRNPWNKPAVKKWCGNENFGDDCKSLLYVYLYFAPLKWFNASDIYRDSPVHIRLDFFRKSSHRIFQTLQSWRSTSRL